MGKKKKKETCAKHKIDRSQNERLNEQTYPNKSGNFRLKHFCISRDTNEIVLHVIKQCLQKMY